MGINTKVEKFVSPDPTVTISNPEILRSRLLLFFALGLFGSIVGIFLDRFLFVQKDTLIFTSYLPYYYSIQALVPVLFLTGIVLVSTQRWSLLRLTVLDLAVSVLCLMVLGVFFALNRPAQSWVFPFILFMLVHSLLVPCRLWVQIVIAATAVTAVIAGQVLSHHFLSEAQKMFFTEEQGYTKSLILQSIEMVALALLSVAITRSLFQFQRSLSNAKRLGNYLIQGELGKGGMGKVFRASHAFMCRPTAVKILRPQNGDQKTSIARFEREVQLSATLNHPNTITIFDYGRCPDNTFFYAMEYLEGMDLQQLIEKFGPIPASRAIYLLSQVCASLGEAHAKGIIHRDIKPSNIFLCYQGGLFDFVKVLDFGLAKYLGEDRKKDLTQSDMFLGTPTYIAPECVHHKEKIDQRTDIYMLGNVAYWILTGHPAFEAGSDIQVIMEHLQNLPKWPSDISPFYIPPELERVVMKCLEKTQEERYPNIAALGEALSGIRVEENWTQDKAKSWWDLHFPPVGEISPSQLSSPEVQNISEASPIKIPV